LQKSNELLINNKSYLIYGFHFKLEGVNSGVGFFWNEKLGIINLIGYDYEIITYPVYLEDNYKTELIMQIIILLNRDRPFLYNIWYPLPPPPPPPPNDSIYGN
jgi:hypothetical protein